MGGAIWDVRSYINGECSACLFITNSISKIHSVKSMKLTSVVTLLMSLVAVGGFVFRVVQGEWSAMLRAASAGYILFHVRACSLGRHLTNEFGGCDIWRSRLSR